MKSRRWRLNHLYTCSTKDGRIVRFRLNWAQQAFLDWLHHFNLILKARQLGFTTFLQIYMLDACLFNSNIRAGTIAHRLDDARIIFRDKLRDVYDRLPLSLKEAIPVIKDSADELVFANNSSIRVSTSMRSGTLQYLHVSEYAQVCARFPEKAREIRTGALNTVQAGQVVFIESTADGQEGHFHELCEQAQTKQRLDASLTPLDFKFNFFPWWRCPEYELDPAGVVIDENFREYFLGLKHNHGIVLTPGQMAWYVKKSDTQLEDMKREYPSTPEEAFEATVEGAYYAQQMAKAELEKRIGNFPAVADHPVHTAWDIGVSDATAIWFFQRLIGAVRLVGYYENSGEGLEHYLDKLDDMAHENGWQYGSHFMPHDIRVREWTGGKTRIEVMLAEVYKRRLGKHVEKVADATIADGIDAARRLLADCEFDAGPCAEGLKALKGYRKDWNEEMGTWRDRPRHDANSHAADAFRYLAVSYRELQPEPIKPEVFYSPAGERREQPGRTWKFLQEMSYDDFHRATGSEIGKNRRHKRTWV